MRRQTWRWSARPARGLAEAGLATFVLTLPLLAVAPEFRLHDAVWTVLGIGLPYAGLASGVIAAFRLRRVEGNHRQVLAREAALAAALILVVMIASGLAATLAVIRLGQPLEAALLGPLEAGQSYDRIGAIATIPMSGLSALPAALWYGLIRSLMLLWPRWDRLRHGRLLWALTHAQAVASLVVAVIAATLLVALNIISGTTIPPNVAEAISRDTGRVTYLIAWVVTQLLPTASALIGVSLAAVFIIVPAAAAISYRVLRRTTRRLEDLAGATAALRAGKLDTRVVVGGEDEVARLQADFNAMASDLERTMQELQEGRDAIARLLQARRELVAAVSHELRTPVATIRGHLDSTLEHWDDTPPPTLRHDLEVMARETERLRRLIDDLFALSRAEVGRLPLSIVPTDVAALLRRSADAAAPLAWQRGRVEVLADAPDDLPAALVDPSRLEQVMRNLVANAVRHTPPGGLVLLSAAAEDGAVVVQVKDTGEGIAPEHLPHIWERFYRSDAARERDQGGAGLGLALVKELTTIMGGTVDVESTVGIGTTFTLRLPAADAGTAPGGDADADGILAGVPESDTARTAR